MKVTDGDCQWLMVTDGDWRWHTVTYRNWWLVSVTDGDLPWSTRVWRSDQKSIVRTREGQLKAVKVFTNNFSIVIPHGTGTRVQVKKRTIPPLGASLYWKVVSKFLTRAPELPYSIPQKALKRCHFGVFLVPKMAFRVPKSKFWDHFSIQTSPQNPQKHTLGTWIRPQKCFLAKKQENTKTSFLKIP